MDKFAGTVRLFPLPNLVMFPHVVQPLHIFEPRYREMLSDALDGDRMIAMAWLTPGWEKDYDRRPPIAPVACLGKIITHAKLPDGRSNLLLAGVSRLQVDQELPLERLYREAEGTPLSDHYPAEGAATRGQVVQQLLDAAQGFMKPTTENEAADKLFSGGVPLGVITDVLAYSLNLQCEVKQQLLAERNVDRRAAQLIEILADPSTSRRGGGFPPEFSEN